MLAAELVLSEISLCALIISRSIITNLFWASVRYLWETNKKRIGKAFAGSVDV
jgi:hypothetical protein